MDKMGEKFVHIFAKSGGILAIHFPFLTEAYKQFIVRFGHLILRKIIKFVATRCQILRLKCTKIDFGWGSAPDPAGRAYSAPPDSLAGFTGPTSKEREEKGKERGRKGMGEEGG